MPIISFVSITDQWRWRSVSINVCHISDDIHCFELLLALAEGEKKYMQIALKFGFEQLVRDFDCVHERLERQDSEQ